jgi:putative MFS transporter
VGISNFGPVIGTLLGAFFVDRIDRRLALGIAAVAMAGLGILFAATSSPFWLIGSGLAFNLVTSLFLPVLVLYAAEMFSTTQRAGATSLAWASNRVGSALVPLALLPVLHSGGAVPVFVVIGLTLTAFVVLVAVLGPKGTPGLAVE